MLTRLISGFSLAAAVAFSLPAQADLKYQANWESLKQYGIAPDWFRDAKFGIYAHWGPYAVPEGPETTDWYSRYMYQRDHMLSEFHEKKYGKLSEFGYKDFVPMFKAEKFDADEWADLFVASGARFAGPVAVHADGFAMWKSQINPWNAYDMGPKQDIVGALEKSVRARGLKFVASFHHHWKWGWYTTMDKTTDAADPKNASLYGQPLPPTAFGVRKPNGQLDPMKPTPRPDQAFADDWAAQVNEAVALYRPDLLWFDNRMEILPEQSVIDVAANYYNSADRWNTDVVLTYKTPDMKDNTGTIDLERKRMKDIYRDPWLTDTSIAKNSWGYASPMEYYSAARIVQDLSDIVSKNGSLLLNIGPKADGSIPQEQVDILHKVGRWLTKNGEAIYSTRPWRVFGEGPTAADTPEGHLADLHFTGYSLKDIRYTRSKDGKTLYAIQFGWPKAGESIVMRELAKGAKNADLKIKKVTVVGSDERVKWKHGSDALTVSKVKTQGDDLPIVLKISLK